MIMIIFVIFLSEEVVRDDGMGLGLDLDLDLDWGLRT